MAQVTGYTAEKMDEISDSAIVGGVVVGNNLILTRRDGGTIDAGDVRGIQGPPGTADASIRVVTSTTRPTTGLFSGLAIYESDTGLFYIWNGAAWKYRGGLLVVTTAQKAALTAAQKLLGMLIFESDKHLFHVWDGANWVCTSPYLLYPGFTWYEPSPMIGQMTYDQTAHGLRIWNGVQWRRPWDEPWGAVGDVTALGTDQFNVGQTRVDIAGASITIDYPANRKLKISASMQAKALVALDGISGYITDGAGTVLKEFYHQVHNDGTGTFQQGSGFVTRVTPTGLQTYKLQASATSSSQNAQIHRSSASGAPQLLIEDIGPWGGPAA